MSIGSRTCTFTILPLVTLFFCFRFRSGVVSEPSCQVAEAREDVGSRQSNFLPIGRMFPWGVPRPLQPTPQHRTGSAHRRPPGRGRQPPLHPPTGRRNGRLTQWWTRASWSAQTLHPLRQQGGPAATLQRVLHTVLCVPPVQVLPAQLVTQLFPRPGVSCPADDRPGVPSAGNATLSLPSPIQNGRWTTAAHAGTAAHGPTGRQKVQHRRVEVEGERTSEPVPEVKVELTGSTFTFVTGTSRCKHFLLIYFHSQIRCWSTGKPKRGHAPLLKPLRQELSYHILCGRNVYTCTS